MPLSETVLAAMIGALATIGTALFQLVSSLRSRTKVETRTRGISFRSLIAIAALMIACGVGGFAYSEMRIEKDSTQMLREELIEQLQALRSSTAKLEAMRASQASPPENAAQPAANLETHPANSAAKVDLPNCQPAHVEAAAESPPAANTAAPQMAASTAIDAAT